MTDEGDTQRLLGELIASGKARSKQMDRIERIIGDLATAHGDTRDMVLEHRTTLRVVKWVVTAALVAISALGFDWWQR